MNYQYKICKTNLVVFKVVAVVLILTISSCNKFLEPEPISEVTAENMWQNQRDVKAGVGEIYSSFRDALRLNFFDWGELRSDNYVLTTEAASDRGRLISNQLTTDMGCTNWAGLYKVINNANFAIKNIPNANLPNTIEKNDFLAQAYAMRALCYFYAVRVWGAVPVYLEPIDNLDKGQFKERTAKEEVLRDVIMPDLKKAEELIDPANVERKRISRFGILAIQADVSMWMEDYEAADRTIDKVRSILGATSQPFTRFEPSMEVLKNTFVTDLNNKTGDLGDRLRDEYGAGNELLFVIHFDLKELNNVAQYSIIHNLFLSGVILSPKLTNIFTAAANTSPRDNRFDNYLQASIAPGTFKVNKYVRNGGTISFNAFPECEVAYPVYRYTDLVLMQAEAKAHLDQFADALNLVATTVRRRAGIEASTRTQASFTSRDELVDYILDERQKELLGEGKRWFDLVRNKRVVKVMGPINGISNESQALFPISYIHINQNPNIKQNPGY
ncbi:RagB/SusD family nutrient uptake outer membrane protein [Pedobacter glucosidilyticus]|jgi:hypothetical protein|uniref:RagB/SusD family nutrient uptake outer membrane protein n=1 Tax=Pedobacter glucosidilyticus TaxID=1122941 RepID=UPI0004245D14|nr:RagB/SusD family nutrient uptake outer membrane protein [Pedobacter glucosidilyticus]